MQQINATPWAEITLLSGQTGYIPDIDCEEGSNFVVLAWSPAGDNGSLDMRFENKDKAPEMTFHLW